MPTYEYLCQSCGARFEAWQKMTDDPIDTCPTCGQPVRRIIFPVGLVFKGSGFYINDTRSASSTAQPPEHGNSGSATTGVESGGEKSGGEKSGGEKSGGDKSGGDKPAAGESSATSQASDSGTTAPATKGAPASGSSGN